MNKKSKISKDEPRKSELKNDQREEGEKEKGLSYSNEAWIARPSSLQEGPDTSPGRPFSPVLPVSPS